MSRDGATMALARRMVAAGAPDGPWQAIGPDRRARFYGRSLHRLALLTIAEGDSGLRLVRWAARPDTRMRLQGEALGSVHGAAAVKAPAGIVAAAGGAAARLMTDTVYAATSRARRIEAPHGRTWKADGCVRLALGSKDNAFQSGTRLA